MISFSHYYCVLHPSLCLLDISLGTIHPANTFNGLNPSFYCILTVVGHRYLCASLYFSHHSLPFSLASILLSPCCSLMAHHISPFPFSFIYVNLHFSNSHVLPLLISPLLNMCCCASVPFFPLHLFISLIFPPSLSFSTASASCCPSHTYVSS